MNIWLLRKHPTNPFGELQSKGKGYLSSFTIAGRYTDRDKCLAVAEKKNKKTVYLFTVKKLKKETVT